YMIAVGAALVSYAMINLTNVTLDANFWYFAMARVIIGFGLPLIFIPMTSASYADIAPDKTDQASALINVARNIGGSIGVSLSQTILAQREQFHQSRLVENIIPSNIAYQQTLAQVEQYLMNQGSSAWEASQQALQWIGSVVQTQAALLAYIDVFWFLALVS